MKNETTKTDASAIAGGNMLTTVFPCKIKVDDIEYTSQEVCQAFGYSHSQFMFGVAISKIKLQHGNVSERYV